MTERLYHGSAVAVEQTDLSLANPKRDFGAGFYTTSSHEQALSFCKIIAKRMGKKIGVVSSYEYTHAPERSVYRFENANLDWLDFVLSNRDFGDSINLPPDIDLIIGPVANDQVGRTLNLLVTGAYEDPESVSAKEFALSLLLTERLTNQWVFKTQKAVDCLKFLGATEYGL